MRTITLKDKCFVPYIPAEQIAKSVAEVASQMNKDLAEKNPLFLCILNGAFMFASDLVKELSFPCEIAFTRISSYNGIRSSGQVNMSEQMPEQIKDRTVVIVEDIIDTGYSMEFLLKQVAAMQPKEIKIASFLFKPSALQCDIHPDYIGMSIDNIFVVGYGLDYDQMGRNLKEIYALKQ